MLAGYFVTCLLLLHMSAQAQTPPKAAEPPCRTITDKCATLITLNPESAIDVPAVQEPHVAHPEPGSCYHFLMNKTMEHSDFDLPAPKGDFPEDGKTCTVTWYTRTCADKSRILQHDENNPPKYWCHRVQP